MKEAKTQAPWLVFFVVALSATAAALEASPSVNELVKVNQLVSHQMEGAIISRNQREAGNLEALRAAPQSAQQPYLKDTLSKRTDVKLSEQPLPNSEKEKPILLADSTWGKFKDAVKEGAKQVVDPNKGMTGAAKKAVENSKSIGIGGSGFKVGPVELKFTPIEINMQKKK